MQIGWKKRRRTRGEEVTPANASAERRPTRPKEKGSEPGPSKIARKRVLRSLKKNRSSPATRPVKTRVLLVAVKKHTPESKRGKESATCQIRSTGPKKPKSDTEGSIMGQKRRGKKVGEKNLKKKHGKKPRAT